MAKDKNAKDDEGMSALDIARYAVAYHEAAHAVVHAMFGLPQHEVVIRQTGWFSKSYAGQARGQSGGTPDEIATVYLVGGFAMARWLIENTDMSVSQARSRGRQSAAKDRSDCREWLRHKDSTLNSGSAHRAAERAVAKHWGRISKVAEALASRGRLSASTVRSLAGAPAPRRTEKKSKGAA